MANGSDSKLSGSRCRRNTFTRSVQERFFQTTDALELSGCLATQWDQPSTWTERSTTSRWDCLEKPMNGRSLHVSTQNLSATEVWAPMAAAITSRGAS